MKTGLRIAVLSVLFGAVSSPGIAYAEGTICSHSENEIRNTKQTAPTDRFILPNVGAYVVDKSTGLMWDRCDIGLDFNNIPASAACVANANSIKGYTWSGALKKAQELNVANYQGYNDWRVPTYKELSSIVERACKNPSANLKVFPDTQSGPHWTSTPVPVFNTRTSIPAYSAFVVTFIDMHLGDAGPFLPIVGTDVAIGSDLSLGNGKYGAWVRLVRTCSLTPVAGSGVDECGLTR